MKKALPLISILTLCISCDPSATTYFNIKNDLQEDITVKIVHAPKLQCYHYDSNGKAFPIIAGETTNVYTDGGIGIVNDWFKEKEFVATLIVYKNGSEPVVIDSNRDYWEYYPEKDNSGGGVETYVISIDENLLESGTSGYIPVHTLRFINESDYDLSLQYDPNYTWEYDPGYYDHMRSLYYPSINRNGGRGALIFRGVMNTKPANLFEDKSVISPEIPDASLTIIVRDADRSINTNFWESEYWTYELLNDWEAEYIFTITNETIGLSIPQPSPSRQ